jgi:hypothetical protein
MSFEPPPQTPQNQRIQIIDESSTLQRLSHFGGMAWSMIRIRLANADWIMLSSGITVLALTLFLPPMPQDVSYHAFADQRTLWGVPHFWNVVSNLPFLGVGLLGLRAAMISAKDGQIFYDSSERWAFVIMFLGVSVTAFGSAYYHWEPNNDRLIWDRLAMAVTFMAFFASTIAERVDAKAGVWLLGPLVLLGVASVVNWHRTDDLRLYAVVQFYPLVMIPVMLCFLPPRYTGTAYVWGSLGWYLAAKILELHPVDHGIFSLGKVLSGHTLKHFAAAAGAFCIYLFLKNRRAFAASTGSAQTGDGAPHPRSESND